MKHTETSLLIVQSVFPLFLISGSLKLYTNMTDWIFIQNVNLIFHEAGHIIFFIFGHFMYVLGGTAGELLIPFLLGMYFLKQYDLYSTGFCLWWLSTAFYGVGIYAQDARSQILPLITGDSSGHDWTFILGELGILRHDQFVGDIFLTLSITLWIISIPLLFSPLLRRIEKDLCVIYAHHIKRGIK